MSPATSTPTPSAPETTIAAAKVLAADLPQNNEPTTPDLAPTAASKAAQINTTHHAPAAPPTRAWKVPELATLNKTPSSAADPTSWPDPATAASENAPPQTPLATTKAAKKGKGKWVPLETEIQYPKPKNATQTPAAPRQPKSQQQQQQNGSAKQLSSPATKDVSDASGAKGVKPITNPNKRQPRSDALHDQHSRQTAAKDAASANNATPAAVDVTVADEVTQQGQNTRGQRQNGRGRGRGRGGQIHTTQNRRGGYRATGHAPSHYQGKGNVQVGRLAPLPVVPPLAGDDDSVKGFVRAQVEYYFSVENLCKDIFFRTQMDPEGFVPLTLISGFNRLKTVTTDTELIRGALVESERVELSESRDRVRKRGDWATWLFPKQELVQQQQEQSDALKSE
ncbi:hypothetical protein GGI21_001237 [Coemansia aciculifera]|uniref:Uncharacterized protein n=1 Tax=Coemansia aciculifera TaxID=417176 RepID=A0ACC1M737_9FUNG|nr:hypothetical protein IWW38_001143 [Coemansia aciculifera]KAJ2910074.1 hypothetical protein GGI21_001237 [Coemansia aciculifera]